MAPNEFRVSAKNRLVGPVYDAERKCPFRKAVVLDIYGDHAIACQGRGDAIAKHDRIRDKIVSACSSANLSPVMKKRTSFQRAHHDPEISLSQLGKRGKTATFDVTVT